MIAFNSFYEEIDLRNEYGFENKNFLTFTLLKT